MGSFFKKIGQWFNDEEKPKAAEVIGPVQEEKTYRNFNDFLFHCQITKLFVSDPLPPGCPAIYELDLGEKDIVIMEDGKPKYMRMEWGKIQVPLQKTITEKDLISCLLLVAKFAQPIDDIYVDNYKKSGGWAVVSGNKLEDRLHRNIYIKDFKPTLLFPEPQFTGVICDGDRGAGVLILLEKIRVVK